MKYLRYIFIVIGITFFMPGVSLATVKPLPSISLSARGVAIYGWNGGKETALYQKKQHWLFPVASISKLATAKAVESLYPPDTLFTFSKTMLLSGTQIANPGATMTRDDLLRSLLISSSNDAATMLMGESDQTAFMDRVNDFLHQNKYTRTSFINPSGLDPDDKTILPNRMTPYQVSRLLSNIYRDDPLLREIMSQKEADLVNQTTNETITIKSSNELNYDSLYAASVIMSKTGHTKLARQNLAFVTHGDKKFEYITIVLLGSSNRYKDGKAVLDWLQNFDR